MKNIQTIDALIIEFLHCTKAMHELAVRLEAINFAKMMARTIGILEDPTLDPIKKLTYAYDSSHIFGGMGSWNDSPPFTAHEMGISEEFERITDDFYDIREQVRKSGFGKKLLSSQ